jgi:CPA1 family monovalent cation:H+ antiporter
MNDGSAFPHRDLIIFITFVVIFITLVFQGLTLPFVIKLTRIQEIDPVLPPHEQQSLIRLRLDTVVLEHLNTHYASASGNSLLRAYIEKLKHDINGHQQFLSSSEACTNQAFEMAEFQQIMSHIHDHQRKELFKMRNEKTFTDEAIRKAEHLIDLNDLRISDSVA